MLKLKHSLLLESLYAHSQSLPSKVAVIAKDEHTDYQTLWRKVSCASAFLQSSGLQKGDKILLSAQKEIEFVYLYFAAQLLGVANVVVDPTSNDERKQFIISQTQPKMIFGLKGVEGSVDYADVVLPEAEPNIDYEVEATDVAEIMFTTGTTGQPKGVLLSHANIAGSASNINSFIGNTADDVEAIGLPICHSFGLGRLRCNVLKGATVVLVGSFANLKIFFDALAKYQVTGFGMVPAVWEYIKKLSGKRIGMFAEQIKYIEIGSAAMSKENKELLCELFPDTRICMHYGLTEASRSFFMEFHQNKEDLATIGVPVTEAVEVAVVGEDGNACKDGEVGELCVKGNMVLKSYLNPKDNETAFWNGYFRTGDCGYKSENGKYYLVSRKKEMINVGGKKVSPMEVEDAIIALGGVKDCVCVAIPDPQGLVGEVPKVYLLKQGATQTIEEIKAQLVGKLEHYKQPVEWDWIDKIPMTSSGKKQRLKINKE